MATTAHHHGPFTFRVAHCLVEALETFPQLRKPSACSKGILVRPIASSRSWHCHIYTLLLQPAFREQQPCHRSKQTGRHLTLSC